MTKKTRPETRPRKEAVPAAPGPAWPPWLPAVILGLLTLALYWPATGFGFINLDDPGYVCDNARVLAGLSWDNALWCFSNPVLSNWHPLTMLVYMAEMDRFGLDPAGFHGVNIVLHALNTGFLFLLLHKLTGAAGRSLLVAALFGWHPMHVESVAWVAELKDVLSTLFWILTLWAYAEYAGQSGRSPAKSRVWYACSLVLFSLGLMCKAMLVTLPCVLVLMDDWPLRRPGAWRWRLLAEKIPFLALAAAASVVTLKVQNTGGAVVQLAQIPLADRVGNALVSYFGYAGKLAWPSDLAVYYPHPGRWPQWAIWLAAAGLGGISWVLLRLRKTRPAVVMGCCWFAGTLVLVIGLVQVGGQAMADRYTYVPSIGLFLAAVWGVHGLAKEPGRYRLMLWVGGVLAAAACAFGARQQLGYWAGSEPLFRRALDVAQRSGQSLHNSELIHNCLGLAILDRGETGEARAHFEEAVRLKPNFEEARINLGITCTLAGDHDGAISQFEEVLRFSPDNAKARYNLGLAYLKKGQPDTAIRHLEASLKVRPDDAMARNNLGLARIRLGDLDGAVLCFEEAVRLAPNDPAARQNLENSVAMKARIDQSQNDPAALNNLAWELATVADAGLRNGPLAVRLARRACELTQYRVTVMVGTLAAAYAEAGKFEEAVRTAEKAVALAAEQGEAGLAKRNEELLLLYRAGRACHQPAAN